MNPTAVQQIGTGNILKYLVVIAVMMRGGTTDERMYWEHIIKGLRLQVGPCLIYRSHHHIRRTSRQILKAGLKRPDPLKRIKVSVSINKNCSQTAADTYNLNKLQN